MVVFRLTFLWIKALMWVDERQRLGDARGSLEVTRSRLPAGSLSWSGDLACQRTQ